jgi:lysophospholipase
MAPQIEEQWFSSQDNSRLFLRSCRAENARATVAILHGYGDHSGRYVHVMESLAAQHISSIAVDYRGHGKADGRRGDCKKWTDYLGDAEAFFVKAKAFAQKTPLFLLGHSHGGLIAIHFMATPRAEVAGLILSSPFLKLAFEPPALKLFGARLIKGILPQLHISNELKLADLSRDEAWQASSGADPLYLRVTTPRWFFEHQAAQDRLAGMGPKITLPQFMLAGTDDHIASMPAAKAFFETIGSKDKTILEYQGFRHEVMNEIEKERPIGDIARWILDHC